MRVLFSTNTLVRSGHFSWCSVPRTLGHHECQRCHGQLYGFALVITIVVAALEFWGSQETGSVSLWSDAWHMVGDAFGYAIGGGYALLALSRLLKTEGLKWVRGACEFLLGAFLVLTACGIFADAGGRLWWGVLPVVEHSGLLFSVAVTGLVVNGGLMFLFLSFGLGHGHDSQTHDHAHRASGNAILRANFWHTFGDAASSLLVVLNAIIFSVTDNPVWGRLDLAVSLVIAGVLFYQGIATFAAQEE